MIRNWTEEELADLLDGIRGVRRFKLLPPGIHTHPGRDKGNDFLYRGCLDLEKMGLIKRTINEPGHVYWEAEGEL